MKNILYIILVISSFTLSQETTTISGDVKDAETGETLIGSTIYIPSLKLGTTSNNYGFFSMTVPNGLYEIEISYVGYKTKVITYNDNIDNLSIALEIDKNILTEIDVTDKRKDINIKSTDIGKVELEIKQINQIPVIGGEKDILKTIQLINVLKVY